MNEGMISLVRRDAAGRPLFDTARELERFVHRMRSAIKPKAEENARVRALSQVNAWRHRVC
jgi:type VI protein secretion system component VasF